MNQLYSLFRACFLLLVPMIMHAQTNPAPQNLPFSLTSHTGSTLPAGIAAHRFGTTASAIPTSRITTPGNADLPYSSSGATQGGWRDDGADGISMVASGSNAAGALIVAINTTGKSNVQVSWTARTILQQASRDNSIALQYRVGTTGNFIDVGTTSTYTSAGKTVGDFASFTETLPAGANNQPEVQVRWIYWESSVGLTGSRDRIGVDDINIVVGCTAPTNQPTALNLTPTLNTIAGSFTAAAAGTTPATGYLVLISTDPTLTEQPSGGTAYAVDDVIGNAVVVDIDNNTTFNAIDLTPSTTYYFFIYSYNAAENCYNIVSPLNGSQATDAPPPCTAPTVQATNLNATNITGSSMELTYTRGNGDNILVVARSGSPVNDNPVNSVTYAVGSEIGPGNIVVYNGPAATFTYPGLTQNTTYYFALYEYNNTNVCYSTSPLTGNFTTSCTAAVDVTALNGTAGNANVVVTWSNPTATCYDEILVVASNAPIPGGGATFTGPANPVYAGPNQVVYRSTGTTVTVTGLTNGTTYYFKVFTKNGTNWSTGVQISSTPFDPATGFMYLYGNLHAHSSYSDGNQDDLTKTPKDDYEFARDANCMDFLGISEHNHAGAGMALADYALGFNQANDVNGVPGGTSGNSIVTLWGMEWGVISGGGHLLVYGFDDQLVGWESGNYNIFVARNDYVSMFNLINNRANAFATLAHPNSGDYGNIAATYSTSADNAVVGTAIESGPAFSTSTSYDNYPSALAYLTYYKTMLARGYHLGAQMDHDNHNMTFGRTSGNRMVVLATSKTRTDLISAIRDMRFYASQDCNVRVDYKCNNQVMGSSVLRPGLPTINIGVIDPDGEGVSSIEIWGGLSGGTVPSAPLQTFTGQAIITFDNSSPGNTQPDNATWYYFAIITQADGNKIVTSPIWYTRSDITLPVQLTQFTAVYNQQKNTSLLKWTTAQEINSESFVIEKSTDGGEHFTDIGTVKAAGSSAQLRSYQFTDLSPKPGTNLYRLRQIDVDGKMEHSKMVSVNVGGEDINYFSVYPNPAQGFTYVYATSASSSTVTIQLLDIQGKLLKQQISAISHDVPVKVPVSGINRGIYFIKVIAQSGSHVERIVVK